MMVASFVALRMAAQDALDQELSALRCARERGYSRAVIRHREEWARELQWAIVELDREC